MLASPVHRNTWFPGELVGRGAECERLDAMLTAVRDGAGGVLVLRGDPGAGKSALLEYAAQSAAGFRVLRAAGIQSEMELPYAGLHQLLFPLLGRLTDLPVPQRDALGTVFGMNEGTAPDTFFVGLAVLNLLSAAAVRQPVLCLVDDEQWLDRASVQVLAFAARRLEAASVGLVFAARRRDDDLARLPELEVKGLAEEDARMLLDSALAVPLDPRVRDQVIDEAGGNPLALLELPRSATPAGLAGGFGLPGAPLSGRIEESFQRRLDELPAQTRRLMLLAAADPAGEPALLWRAASLLGICPDAAFAAIDAGLAEFGGRVRFRHPLVRSAAYRQAPTADRRDVHRALAEATDSGTDPDRRAWHRAQAAAGPDEDVAAELERSAGRARARGGLAAAAAFLEQSATLTPEKGRRAWRMLAAVQAKRDSGALNDALGLLATIEADPSNARQVAEAERLRGEIASDQSRHRDAAPLLLSAARRLEAVNPRLSRETHLEALWEVAMWASDLDGSGTREAALAARAAPAPPGSPGPVDALLDAMAVRLTDGYPAAAPGLARSLELFRTLDVRSDDECRWLWLTAGAAGSILALELWDFESLRAVATRRLRVARENGALIQFRSAAHFAIHVHILRGELTEVARLLDEDRVIAELTGSPPVSSSAIKLAAWRGEEARTLEVFKETTRDRARLGLGRLVNHAMTYNAVLYNGLGRYDAALANARQSFESNHFGVGSLVIAELAEAAARTGETALVQAALERIAERTSVSPTDWSLGTEARIRALLSEGDCDAAERWYTESIELLGRTPIRAELTRSRLLYGEWLRRHGRRADARTQLRTAHETFVSMGAGAFADRARRELVATGATVSNRSARAAGEQLTAQEAQVARLARDGLSNPQIATRLFISSRTVQYHLGKVFTKLEIRSRAQLQDALPGG